MGKTFQDLMKEITDWQDSVFTKATPLSAAEHLRREVRELIFDLTNGSPESAKAEMADCQLLLIAVAHLSGVDLETAVEEKMIINRRRVWGAPDDQGVVEHIEEEIFTEWEIQTTGGEFRGEFQGNLIYEGENPEWKGKTLLEVFEAEGLIPPAIDGAENILIKISKGESDGQIQVD